MKRWAGRVALVTGASAGIGAAIAYQLQDHGVHVVAVARRVDQIEAVVSKARDEAKARGQYEDTKRTPGKLYAKKCDVAKEEDILEVFKWIKNNLGGVDILVNNAGLGFDDTATESPTETSESKQPGTCVRRGLSNIINRKNTPKNSKSSTENWRTQLNVNVLGLSICTREAVQSMRARGVDDGHIVHISSCAGHKVISNKAPMYSATKHAVMALAEGLRKDFVEHKSKMKISVVSPGIVETEFVNNMKSVDKSMYNFVPVLHSEDVADAVLYAIGTPPHVQIHEIIIKPVGESF